MPTGRAPRRGRHAETQPAAPPRGEVAGPAARLDRGHAVDRVGQYVCLRLGDAEDAPCRLVGRPGALAGSDVFDRPRVPGDAIAGDVFGKTRVTGRRHDGSLID